MKQQELENERKGRNMLREKERTANWDFCRLFNEILEDFDRQQKELERQKEGGGRKKERERKQSYFNVHTNRVGYFRFSALIQPFFSSNRINSTRIPSLDN